MLEELDESSICSPVRYGSLTEGSRKFWMRELYVAINKPNLFKDSYYGKVIDNLCRILQDDGGMKPESRHIRYADLPEEILLRVLDFKIPYKLKSEIEEYFR